MKHLTRMFEGLTSVGAGMNCKTTSEDEELIVEEGGAVCLGGPTYPRLPWGSVTRWSDVPSRERIVSL